MSLTVTPHLNFRGQARAALDFYGMLTDRFGVTWIVDVEPGAA